MEVPRRLQEDSVTEGVRRVSPYKAAQASYVLWLVRDRQPVALSDLFAHFGWSVGDRETAPENLRNTIDALERVGLIKTSGHSQVVAATSLANDVAQVLGISIKQLASSDPQRSMTVSPSWGLPAVGHLAADLFVLMPFSPESDRTYTNHIRRVASEFGLSCKRADEFFTVQSVMKDIWSAISMAKAVLADLTGRNPNVFYELGIAHTLGKPAVLVTQNIDDVPFDVRGWRIIEYVSDPDGLASFEGELRKALLNLDLAERDK